MKRLIILLALITSYSYSQESQFYLGYGGIYGQFYTIDSSSLSPQAYRLLGLNEEQEAPLDEVDQYNLNLNIGYKIDAHWDFNLEYATAISFDSGYICRLACLPPRFVETKFHLTNLSISYHHPLRYGFNLFTKAGTSRVKQTYRYKENQETIRRHYQDDQETLIGGGVEWEMNSSFAVRAGIEYITFHELHKTYINLVWMF